MTYKSISISLNDKLNSFSASAVAFMFWVIEPFGLSYIGFSKLLEWALGELVFDGDVVIT